MIDAELQFEHVKANVTITESSWGYMGMTRQNFILTDYSVAVQEEIKLVFGHCWKQWNISVNGKAFRRMYDYMDVIKWLDFYLRMKESGRL